MVDITGGGKFVDEMRYPSTWNPEQAQTYYLTKADGKPVLVNIGEQRSTIKMAQEMLEALK